MPRRYKDYRFYAFVALNYIAQTLEFSIYQDGIMDRIDVLLQGQRGVSKSEIMHEIKSNHNMTNKVLKYLEDEGLVRIEKSQGSYRIFITPDGVRYLREYSRFYITIFASELRDHYKYRDLPSWAKIRD